VNVTVNPECTWTVSTAANWITLMSSSGQGSGKADFRVAPNSGTARQAALTVNSQTVQVDEGGCTFTLSDSGQTLGMVGGPASVGVKTGSACTWTAASNAEWITITAGASGTGPGPVNFTVAPNPGESRSGSLTIAGQTYSVTQGIGCAYTVAPLNQSVASGSGSASVSVSSSAAQCAWTASSLTDWIKIASGSSGSGSGSVAFTFTSNTSTASRTGQLTIAGQTASVTQAGALDCTTSVNPTVEFVGAGGGAGAPIAVNVANGCSWSASSNAGWLSITAGTTGNGVGSVAFNIAANPGPQRVGTLTVAGQTVTITQAGGCTFALNPASGQSVPSTAGSYPVMIINASSSSCGWTAAVTTNFTGGGLSVAPAGGTGNGSVTLTVTANAGPQRVGTLTIAGQAFTVTQASGCTYGISPSSAHVPSAGGHLSQPVTVTTSAGCTWTAVSNVPWITQLAPANGSGPGTVTFTFTVAPGGPRSGTLTIATQAFTVNQP
jgi:hypothetical protein